MPPKQTTKAKDTQPLLTSTSVAASLSPPRFPPHDSNLRQLYKTNLHPHLPTSLSIPDQLTRFLGTILPLDTQHSFRDNGYFRAVADTAVKLTCPSLGIRHWTECKEFIELSRIQSQTNNGKDIEDKNNNSKRKRRRRWTRRKIAYGDHSMQYIDLFLPTSDVESNTTKKSYSRIPIRGTIFFVHGGAWGSGHPWMYRLVAPTFLKMNFAVCIVGYRTYPDAKDIIEDQTKDVQLAWETCGYVLNELVVPISSKEWVGNVVMGHSSGAHVGLLMLVEWVGDQMKKGSKNSKSSPSKQQQYPWIPNYFIGLSGPYDISYHFDYEGGRGVEQISPLKPICGHTRENFNRASPVKRLLALLPKQTDDSRRSGSTIQQLMPPILLMHGIEDTVVPFTATSDAGRQLRSFGLRCDEIYLSETGHQDVIMHVMLGGKAKDLTLDWLFNYCDESGEELQATHILSRL